jgi:hypothetical protein
VLAVTSVSFRVNLAYAATMDLQGLLSGVEDETNNIVSFPRSMYKYLDPHCSLHLFFLLTPGIGFQVDSFQHTPLLA